MSAEQIYTQGNYHVIVLILLSILLAIGISKPYQAFIYQTFGAKLYVIWAVLYVTIIAIFFFSPFRVITPMLTLAFGLAYYFDVKKLRKYLTQLK
ncbi:hypothetical protein KAR50_05645 [Periweissella fabaria]|uniref:Uncharacterized protein n=1 Tax=Periweissella fabaria TaxID=546157 RepID=A0ABM8Z4M1_9LACO|nr:hypothetical protein [Periweissella fabaria]MCM0597325.1 hypothetical protein [Periweissella fabaria]CAH0416171.1 hypothetical protein WFA24289_00470 [Periweissella fabaria]